MAVKPHRPWSVREEGGMNPTVKLVWAFAKKWMRHETDCAIHFGKDCTCGLFEEENAIKQKLHVSEIEPPPGKYCVR